MRNYIVSKSFGKVEFIDDNGDGGIKQPLVCPVCKEKKVDGIWYLKDCPNYLLVGYECENCHKVWQDEEVTEHNMDLSNYCDENGRSR